MIDQPGLPPTTDPQTRVEYAEAQRLATELAGQRYRSWSPEDREDLVNEVLVKYYRKFGRGSAPQNPRGWIATVLRTTAIDLHRPRPDELPVNPLPAEHEILGQAELVELLGAGRKTPSLVAISDRLVNEVLSLVSADQADLIRHRFLEGWSAADMALRSGRTIDAINQATSRAKRALAAALAERPDLVDELRAAFPRLY